MRVALLGLGLIGGSVARALHERDPASQVQAWSPTGSGPAAALRAGVIARACDDPEDAIDGADLIILAAPAGACLGLLDDLAGPWRGRLAAAAVITDVASTKQALVLRALALGLRYVGGHPMAGRESDGFGASTPDLFVDRPWVIVPGGDPVATTRVERLAETCGARPVRMTAAAHDAAVAAISHLPLVVAASMVEAVAGGATSTRSDWSAAAALAASGWVDSTRLARGSVTMGTGIISTNSEAIAARLRDLVAVLEVWALELERSGGPDPEVVADKLANARARLTADRG